MPEDSSLIEGRENFFMADLKRNRLQRPSMLTASSDYKLKVIMSKSWDRDT